MTACRENSGKVFYWIVRIAHNVIIDYYREQKNDKSVDVSKDNDLNLLKSAAVIGDNRENELSSMQIKEDVVFLMNLLPDLQRDVVYMRYFQNMSFKEIAEETHVSINTSLGRMRYALMNMRKLSKEYNINLYME